jgi:hypothetical protein
MAEVKLAAGAKLDVLNRAELKQVLDQSTRDWFNQVARGDRYRRFSAKGTIATGALLIDGAQQTNQQLGPQEGFVWAVQRVAVQGLTTVTGTPAVATTEPLQVFLNDDGPSSLVHPAVVGYQDFGQYSVVMYPGDTLLFKGSGLASTGQITVTGQVREVPLPLAWRLGG